MKPTNAIRNFTNCKSIGVKCERGIRDKRHKCRDENLMDFDKIFVGQKMGKFIAKNVRSFHLPKQMQMHSTQRDQLRNFIFDNDQHQMRANI